MQHLLRQFQIECDVAYNGKEAIDKIIMQPSLYQLVLMDCQMPIMDGFEASRLIIQKIQTREGPHQAMFLY